MQEKAEMKTKEKFAIEALRLFADKGYEAVSIAEIANAVGCSAPALYKHYKNKQELLDAIIKNSEDIFKNQMAEEKNNLADDPMLKECISGYTEEQEIARMQKVFTDAIHIEAVQLFRKMCLVEQFHMKNLAEIYTYRYITYQTDQAENVMQILMNQGKIKKGNARVLARIYMSIPMMCIGICDREPEREEECLELIAEHIREFNRNYRII